MRVSEFSAKSRYNGAARRQAGSSWWAGPLATISREPGQARKGAAAVVALCAGVWLETYSLEFDALALKEKAGDGVSGRSLPA